MANRQPASVENNAAPPANALGIARLLGEAAPRLTAERVGAQARSEDIDFGRTDVNGGEGGIRTPGTVARTPHFECGAIDHSATSPAGLFGLVGWGLSETLGDGQAGMR